MMLALAMVGGLSSVVALQVVGGNQAGAQYVGTRPVLNKNNCANLNERVEVLYNVSITTTTNPTTGQVTQPVAVFYTQDSAIPSSTTTTTTTTNPQTGQQQTNLYVSPVSCNEPTAETIIPGKDNIFLTPGTSSFRLSTQGISIPVNDLMADLCSADGGVRKRRAICLGIRSGQGGTTTVRAGDGPDIDTEVPGQATKIDAQPGDGEATLSVTPPAGGDAVERAQMQYRVDYRQCTESESIPDAGSVDAAVLLDADGGVIDAGAPAADDEGSCGGFTAFAGAHESPVTVTGLSNDVRYEFRVRAVDEAGNEGPRSTARAFATPKKEYGFLDLYGDPEYVSTCQNCQMTGDVANVAVAVGALALLTRRRRRSNG